MKDERPKLAEVFRRLQAGEGPLWITWRGRRLLLGAPDEAWRQESVGPVIVATRRGYRRVDVVGRIADGGHLRSKRGKDKHQPLRTEDDYFRPLADDQVRAVILEDHARIPDGDE